MSSHVCCAPIELGKEREGLGEAPRTIRAFSRSLFVEKGTLGGFVTLFMCG